MASPSYDLLLAVLLRILTVQPHSFRLALHHAIHATMVRDTNQLLRERAERRGKGQRGWKDSGGWQKPVAGCHKDPDTPTRFLSCACVKSKETRKRHAKNTEQTKEHGTDTQ